MENALELIKEAHQVDRLLGRVAEAVDDHALKARILEVKEQWQPLAYEVSASLAGVETAGLSASPRKRRTRKKSVGAGPEGEGSCGTNLS